MRLSPIIPLLFTLTAFILTLLCIFAGSKQNYLENAEMLTLNTSLLGQNTINTTTDGASHSSILSGIEHGVQSVVNDVANDIASDIAKAINIHDFYSAHLLDYCEGYYTPSPLANATSHPSKNVTKCSNHTGLFHFDPTFILQSELKTGVNLTDLKWPSKIQDAIKAVEMATKVMFVLYCLGAAAAGLAVVGAMVGAVTGGRLSDGLNFAVDMLAFLALLIASAISTYIIDKVCNAINKYGSDISIAAYKGHTFIGMTWAATVLVLLAAVVWIYEFVRGRREKVVFY